MLQKALNIFRKVILILISVLLLLYIAIQTDMVQNALVRYATGKLSAALGTEVSIKKVSVSFFSKLSMDGIAVKGT